MSDRSGFSHEQDELASAYLDDEVTTEERARVDADPALLVRVEELRSVRDALADPVAFPATAERDADITAALNASNVVNLDVARGQRRLLVASIAAAVLVVLGAAGLLIRAADRSTEKFNAVSAPIGSATDSQAAERAAGASAGAGATDAFSAIGRPTLGSFVDRSSLAAAAQTQVHNPARDSAKQATGSSPLPPAAGTPTTTAPSCLVPPPSGATNEVYAATAVLQGRAVQIDVFTVADGSLMLVVTDAASCTQVFTQPV